MITKRTFGPAALLAAAVILGCSALPTFQKTPQNQQHSLFQDIQSQPGAYRAFACPNVYVIEPKSDGRSVEVTGQGCGAIDPQAAPLPDQAFKTTTFRSLVGEDNQVYAFAYWNFRAVRVGARQLDATTMAVSYTRVEFGGP